MLNKIRENGLLVFQNVQAGEVPYAVPYAIGSAITQILPQYSKE